jgi:hypothetical protein
VVWSAAPALNFYRSLPSVKVAVCDLICRHYGAEFSDVKIFLKLFSGAACEETLPIKPVYKRVD